MLIGPVLLVTGALDRPAAPAARLAPVAAAPDPAGTALLERAVAELQPERVPWVEAAIWQKVVRKDFAYQAEGRYLAAPGRRLRVDVRVRVGRTHGELHMIGDGRTHWETVQLEGGPPAVSRVEPARVLRDLPDAHAAEVRAEYFPELSHSGPAGLLEEVRRHMTVVGAEQISWDMRRAVRLTLQWNARTADSLAVPDRPWPAYLPRRCVLTLDAETLWPYRLEWWGPGRDAERELALVQMEFRDPVLNQPLTRARCAREFTFRPGGAEVPDQSREVARFVKAQLGQAGP
jgi:hypothetical protein